MTAGKEQQAHPGARQFQMSAAGIPDSVAFAPCGAVTPCITIASIENYYYYEPLIIKDGA